MAPLLLPQIIRADFLTEARTGRDLPSATVPEVAVSGRSNVGKSTLLNALAARRALARVSKTPGRTRGVMFYEVEPRFSDASVPMRFVDLPGYGYAQVSKNERESWRKLIEGYVKGRSVLKVFLILVDARRGIEPEELQLVEWLDTLGVASRLVVTKADKLSASERGLARDRLKKVRSAGHPPPLLVSGETGEGMDVLWNAIRQALVPREQDTSAEGRISAGFKRE